MTTKPEALILAAWAKRMATARRMAGSNKDENTFDRIDAELRRLHVENDANRDAMRKALEALVIGRDAAYSEAYQFHAAMEGHRQSDHDSKDDDVAQVDAALALIRQRLGDEA